VAGESSQLVPCRMTWKAAPFEGANRRPHRPVRSTRPEFADAAEAHRYLESNEQVGKVVITVQH
jgi:NADPH:quinone reductase-like Zn-dependent oxidoreductase